MLPKPVKPQLIKDVRSDINVTPLVDVCLVLLIIFMVVTPMLQNGVDVLLPKTPIPEKMPENSKQVTVSLKQDGTVFIGQSWVTDANLPGQLANIHTQNPDKAVVIKGDARLKYKQVRTLMKQVNEAGFSRVGLVTQKLERNGG